jgi:excisionase family DNA binding protein
MSSNHINHGVIYQVQGEELERLITRAVTNAMERYTANVTPVPAVNGGDLMTAAEVCEHLHVTAATLHNWDKKRYLQKVKVGRRVLYHRSDVEALAAQTKKQ